MSPSSSLILPGVIQSSARTSASFITPTPGSCTAPPSWATRSSTSPTHSIRSTNNKSIRLTGIKDGHDGRLFFLLQPIDYRTVLVGAEKFPSIGQRGGGALDFFMDGLQNAG